MKGTVIGNRSCRRGRTPRPADFIGEPNYQVCVAENADRGNAICACLFIVCESARGANGTPTIG